MLATKGMIGVKGLGRCTPSRSVLNLRGFLDAGCDDSKRAATEPGTESAKQERKTTTTTTTREEPADKCDPDEIPTPSLRKATTTKDFFISVREERLREKAKECKQVDVMKVEETFRKGASAADLDSG